MHSKDTEIKIRPSPPIHIHILMKNLPTRKWPKHKCQGWQILKVEISKYESDIYKKTRWWPCLVRRVWEVKQQMLAAMPKVSSNKYKHRTNTNTIWKLLPYQSNKSKCRTQEICTIWMWQIHANWYNRNIDARTYHAPLQRVHFVTKPGWQIQDQCSKNTKPAIGIVPCISVTRPHKRWLDHLFF